MSAKSSAPSRLAYLDMTKGILVGLMVVYHSLNYTNQYHLGFRYLAFLPISFVVITGFLLSSVYSPRYRAREPGIVRRLVIRGVRLVALFTLLNVVAQFVRSPEYGQSIGVARFFQSWFEVYVAGGSGLAAFDVLLPIGYLLLLAPWLIVLADCHPSALPAASVILVVGCASLDRAGIALANISFIIVGVVGMLAGRLFPDLSKLGKFFWLTALAYAVYVPLRLVWSWSILTQLLGALVALALIVAASVRLGDKGWWRQRLIRIGQYSLIAYIGQIGILQILSRVVGRPDPLSPGSAFLFFATFALMLAAVELTDWLRKQSAIANRVYVGVFA